MKAISEEAQSISAKNQSSDSIFQYPIQKYNKTKQEIFEQMENGQKRGSSLCI